MVSFPYYSHIFRDSYGSGMRIVWVRGPIIGGVPKNPTQSWVHHDRCIFCGDPALNLCYWEVLTPEIYLYTHLSLRVTPNATFPGNMDLLRDQGGG